MTQCDYNKIDIIEMKRERRKCMEKNEKKKIKTIKRKKKQKG